jgi:hypothetical protein
MYKETLSAVVALAIWLMSVVAVATARTGDGASLFRRETPAYSQVMAVEARACQIGTC